MAVDISPPPHVEFLSQLASKLTTAPLEAGIRLAGLMKNVEPLVFHQEIGKDTLEGWDQEIREQLEEFVQRGEKFTPTDWYQDEFLDPIVYVDDPDWYEQSGKIVDIAEAFYRWAPLSPPDSLEELDQLRAEVGPFPDPDQFEDGDRRTRSDDTYWTIARLFEDL